VEKYHVELCYRLKNKNAYLIGIRDEQDSLIVDNLGFVRGFKNSQSLHSYAQSKGISFSMFPNNSPEGSLVDLDYLENWLLKKKPRTLKCDELLNAWNLFLDVSTTVGHDFDQNHEETNQVYDKLFFGCNLPSVTPPGKSYFLIWSSSEIKLIRSTLAQGLQMFKDHVKLY
jgi:hypothetical protein